MRRAGVAGLTVCPAKRINVRLATNLFYPKQKMRRRAGRGIPIFWKAFEQRERRFGYNPRIAGEMAEWLKAAVC